MIRPAERCGNGSAGAAHSPPHRPASFAHSRHRHMINAWGPGASKRTTRSPEPSHSTSVTRASWAYAVAPCRTLCGDTWALYVYRGLREKRAVKGSSVRLSGKKEEGAVPHAADCPRNARPDATSRHNRPPFRLESTLFAHDQRRFRAHIGAYDSNTSPDCHAALMARPHHVCSPRRERLHRPQPARRGGSDGGAPSSDAHRRVLHSTTLGEGRRPVPLARARLRPLASGVSPGRTAATASGR